MTTLLTGGSGRLGRILQHHYAFTYVPTHSEFDITDRASISAYCLDKTIDLIIHTAAYTNVVAAEADRSVCYEINVRGTENVARLGIPLLYISTDYIFDGKRGNYREDDLPYPRNWYALTKWLGEFAAGYRAKIIRSGFRPRPFPYPKAFIDQWTSADYIDVIAPEIAQAIQWYDQLPRITHIGTERKTMYELARRSNPRVGKTSRLTQSEAYRDVSLNSEKWEKLKHDAFTC